MISGSFEPDDADATNSLILTFLQITQETVLQVAYASRNPKSKHGQGLRYLRFLEQGFVKDTEYGHEEDETPGWWCVDPNVKEEDYGKHRKFFLTERFLDIRNVPRVPTRPESPPREPDPPAVEREDLRSRSPSPELESADLPDDDPLAA